MESTPLPPELVCPICSSLLEDAVMMPCCAGTACEPCARAGGGTCPVCGEVASTEELIPYRLFRDKVDKFCSQTGYARARPSQHHPQPSRPPKPSLPDIVLPTLQSHRPPGSSVTDSPRGTSPPRPQTPTPSPPRSPGTPLSYPDRMSGSPLTPHAHPNKAHGRGTSTSSEFISNPKPPGPTLLPPVHVLAPSSHWPPSSSHPSAPLHVLPTFLHPTEDPLAAFEAAMRKLDSKKASRGRHDQVSPPRAYREERTRSRSRERLRDYREREFSSRKKSPGGHRNSSPRVRASLIGSSYLAASTSAEAGSRSNFRNEGKSRDVQEDYVELAWSRPRRERYVTDIPPETQEERRDRERFERNLAKRESGSYSSRTETRRRAGPDFEYQEMKGTESKAHDVDSRTPSLSPDPEGKYECGRWGEVGRGFREDTDEMKDKKVVNKEKLRDIRDDENCRTKFINDEEYTRSSYQYRQNLEVSQSDRSYDRGGEREISGYEEHCEEDAKYKDEHQGGMNKLRKGEEMQDMKRRSLGEDLVYFKKSESKAKLTAESEKEKSVNGDVKREMSNEDEAKAKVHENGKRIEDELLNAAVKQRSEVVEQEKASSEEKELKKVKKSKKSKKNKVKDKESRKSNKERRKRKKRKKRGNDIDEGSKSEEDVKSLVPYDEADDTKTEDSSAENQEDKSSLTSNFISSFKETKIESRRGKIDLSSLVFNYKIEDFAQKKVHSKEREKAILAKLQLYSESLSSSSPKQEVKCHSKDVEMKEKNKASDVQACGSPELQAAPPVSSKWEMEDILTAEYPELKHPLVTDPESVAELPKPSVQGSSSGPQNVLRKALANMEKDHMLREKKQKSLEGTKFTKKKKKKSRGDDSSEDESRLKKKKRKKKKSGLEIPEKTLKKLLKKNLIRKEALEKLISKEGGKKKRKKKYSDAEKGKGRTRQSSSEDEIDKKHVKASKLNYNEGAIAKERSTRRKGSEERKGHMSGSSEEGREVKASREGKIQVRLAIRESSSLTPGKKSLASTLQANLLKMASQDSSGRGERGRRGSPERRSVKDRLGPVRREHSSPVRRSSLRENNRRTRFEGRKTFGRDAYESKMGEDNVGEGESGGLGPVPAKLQAWAGRHSPIKQDRDNRRREKNSSAEESCKERRRKHGNH